MTDWVEIKEFGKMPKEGDIVLIRTTTDGLHLAKCIDEVNYWTEWLNDIHSDWEAWVCARAVLDNVFGNGNYIGFETQGVDGYLASCNVEMPEHMYIATHWMPIQSVEKEE